jgi:hypothetical protein
MQVKDTSSNIVHHVPLCKKLLQDKVCRETERIHKQFVFGSCDALVVGKGTAREGEWFRVCVFSVLFFMSKEEN